MNMDVGYIGLGAMGGALARRLLASHRLHVWDINTQATGRFAEAGATVAATPAELGRRCRIVLLCLPRSSDVRKVVLGPAGLAESLTPGAIIVDQTSGVPEETRAIAAELAARGITMLDAPVAGGVAAAEAGRITMMVSGPTEAFQQVEPVLHAISPTVVRAGERLGDGQAMKMLNNAMNADCRLATLEVVAMGRKMGLSLAAMTEAINQSSGRSRISQNALPALLEGRPSSDFALPLMVKDVDQALALGMRVGAPLPIAGITRSLLQVGVNMIGPEARLEDMIGLIESMAGTRLPDGADATAATQVAATESSAHQPVIGYVGLGAMGAALARRLLACECKVHVYDVRPESVRELESAGAIAAPDLPTLARACDVIMVCVPTSAVVREVVFGPRGLIDGLAAGKIVVDQTTGDPAATRAMAAELEARGVRMVDAPVSGGPAGAAQGTMVTFCGGPAEAFARVRPLLTLTGPTVVHFGPTGSGNVAKLIKNTLGACNRLITYETVALGVKAGLKLDDMARVISKSSGWTQAFERIMPVLATHGRTADLRIELMVKDLDLACQLGMECGAPMLIANAVRAIVEAAANELGGGANLDELSRLYEARAGIKWANAGPELR
ncbi:MAG TPA: NAD(P)-dependent oxidoreductase [Ramlibacter sp.]|nr:NAD(P)-dependent oxidoreductase [Ramlibacter sp.]